MIKESLLHTIHLIKSIQQVNPSVFAQQQQELTELVDRMRCMAERLQDLE